ncbi:MAG: hypothetical protein Q9208_003103 [Pyrenodesmia sp. 3 TL-2023]
MGGVIEILLPRYSITPLDRTDDGYWTQGTKQSILKGGTWMMFNWNQLATGHATQRIQYSSDLRVPQAEVSLEELFDFMLDRGAVPDTKGIHMLRVSGLWTPTGTCLMLSPDSSQVALRISMPDDSDGVLSLALQWKPEWNKRDHSSLPPGWMRLDLPTTTGKKQDSNLDDDEKPVEPEERASQEVLDDCEKPEVLERKESSNPPAYVPLPTAIRFHLSSLAAHPYVQLKDPTYEHKNMPLRPAPKPLDPLMYAATPWLASLCLALSLSYSYPTSFLNLPTFLYALASSSSIPCGVLVMADLLSSNDAPEWETIYSANEPAHERQQRLTGLQQALARERILPPGQRQQAQELRAHEELSASITRAKRRQKERAERAENREREALGSQKMGIDLAVNAALAMLQAEGSIAVPKVDDEAKTEEKDVGQLVVERLLLGIYKASSGIDLPENQWALDVCEMLNRWRDWSSRGGMNKEDLRLILNDRRTFCWAVAAVGLVTRVCEKEKADGGGLLGDVRECLRVWKNVRVG